MKIRPCELCNADAAVFCPSDNAFLCRSCDAEVHEANFLVARHVRRPVCSNCRNLHPFLPTICPTEDHGDDLDDSLSSSDSSVCVSSTTSPGKEYSGAGNRESRGFDSFKYSPRQRADYFKAEGIFINWCGKLGVAGVDMAVRTTALRALQSVCLDRRRGLPFRVYLAALLWLGLRLSCERRVLTLQVLKRLEEISGVPAKVIIAAEAKLEKALRGERQQQRPRVELEERWAEC